MPNCDAIFPWFGLHTHHTGLYISNVVPSRGKYARCPLKNAGNEPGRFVRVPPLIVMSMHSQNTARSH